MASNETVLLKSTLEIQNKSYSVKLTSSEIYWESISSARASGGPYSEPLVSGQRTSDLFKAYHEQSIASSYECGVVYYCNAKPSDGLAEHDNVILLPFPSEPVIPTCCLCGAPLDKTENQTAKLNEIIAVKIGNTSSPKDGNDGKFRNLEMVSMTPTMFSIWVVRRTSKHRWRCRKVIFQSKDTSVIHQWVDKIQDILKKPEFGRPKSLLVFINPISGAKKGPKIYNDKIAPLFELAGITTEVITTQRQNHARDTVMDYDLKRVDGVVAVGGDGMFTELMHGLLNRTLRENGVDHPTPDTALIQPATRLGIIAAGSTDTLSWTSQGFNDPITSALHIIVGDNVSMDVSTVFHGNQFLKYNMSLCGYGYYGDCVVDSESNRWMGPKRYDWEGFKKVLRNRSYEGELMFLPSTDRENHVRDGTFCKAGCQTCQAVSNDVEQEGYREEEGNWQKIKGRFVAINSFQISCRCRFSVEGPAPAAHMGDGLADLVIIHECSRIDYTRHLVRCVKKSADQFDFPFVQVFRVREFKFRPLVDEIEDTHEASDVQIDGQQRLRSRSVHNSVWNCDGEPIDEPAIDLRVHRQAIKLFARGIEDEIKESPRGVCYNCACVSER